MTRPKHVCAIYDINKAEFYPTQDHGVLVSKTPATKICKNLNLWWYDRWNGDSPRFIIYQLTELEGTYGRRKIN